MMPELKTVQRLYKKLIRLYPRSFREQLGASMAQTFHDLWNEQRHKNKGLFGFVLRTFSETAIGIFREYRLLILEGDTMQTMLKTLGSSALISFLLILPFMIMEVVNRRNFKEDFPFMLFFILWLDLFAISLILLPIVRGRRTGNRNMAHPVPVQGNTLLANPRLAAILGIALILAPGILPLLNSAGWLSTDRLFNGPNPEVAYLPGLVISLVLILFPVAAGVIASRPIVHTLRAGGSLFAHPLHLIIVVFTVSAFVIGFASFLIDQWTCFIGVPNCD